MGLKLVLQRGLEDGGFLGKSRIKRWQDHIRIVQVHFLHALEALGVAALKQSGIRSD